MVWKKLAHIAAVLLLMWLVVVFGVNRPLDKADLLGATQQQVIEKYGQPAAVWKRKQNGNDVWVYSQGWLLRARTNVEFKNGIVVDVRGSSPAR